MSDLIADGNADPAAYWHPSCAGVAVVDEVPKVYALYRDDDYYEEEGDEDEGDDEGEAPPPARRPRTGVIAWVFSLPDEGAVVLRTGNSGSVALCRSIESVAARYARLADADLVYVTERTPTPR